MDKNKITVFVPTGENREPKEGEWFLNESGNHARCSIKGISQHPIYERIEIKIPEGAQCLAYHFCNTNAPMKNTHGSIILSRPKVKIKKIVDVSLFNDATAKWDPKDIDLRGIPKYIGTFPVEIEVEE